MLEAGSLDLEKRKGEKGRAVMFVAEKVCARGTCMSCTPYGQNLHMQGPARAEVHRDSPVP